MRNEVTKNPVKKQMIYSAGFLHAESADPNDIMQKNIWQTTKHPILALAPMAGYTDPAFRVMCLKNGADIVYTEMISVEALWRKNKKTLAMLKLLPSEKNVILQLFGNKPESFEKALKIINSSFCRPGESQDPETSKTRFWIKSGMTIKKLVGIDINFGCPAHKVFKTGAGAALMNNKKLAREIIKTVLENTNLPISIKIRSQVKNVSAIEFINYIKDLSISAVMIHGRSLKQGFAGEIDYEMIKNIKKLLPNIPVLTNGGIYTPADAKIMLTKTNADGLGIARGAWGRPWIFSQCCHPDDSDGSQRRRDPVANWKFVRKQMLAHAKLFLKYNDNLIPLRKHLIHYTKGLKNASELRQKMIKVETIKELEKLGK